MIRNFYQLIISLTNYCNAFLKTGISYKEFKQLNALQHSLLQQKGSSYYRINHHFNKPAIKAFEYGASFEQAITFTNLLQAEAIKEGLSYHQALRFEEDPRIETESVIQCYYNPTECERQISSDPKDPLLEIAINRLNLNKSSNSDVLKINYYTKAEALVLGYSYRFSNEMPSNLQAMLMRKGVPHNISINFKNHWQVEMLRSGATYDEAISENTQLNFEKNCALQKKIKELYNGHYDKHIANTFDRFTAIANCPSDQDIQDIYKIIFHYSPLENIWAYKRIDHDNFIWHRIDELINSIAFNLPDTNYFDHFLFENKCISRNKLEEFYNATTQLKLDLEPNHAIEYLTYNFITDVIENYIKNDAWEQNC